MNFGANHVPFSEKLIQASFQIWMSFPNTGLAHDLKSEISKKWMSFPEIGLAHDLEIEISQKRVSFPENGLSHDPATEIYLDEFSRIYLRVSRHERSRWKTTYDG